jgi:hypothetical protein
MLVIAILALALPTTGLDLIECVSGQDVTAPPVSDGTCDNKCRERLSHDFCGTDASGTYTGASWVFTDCQNCTGGALTGCTINPADTGTSCVANGEMNFTRYTKTPGPLCNCNNWSLVEGSVTGFLGGPDVPRKVCL